MGAPFSLMESIRGVASGGGENQEAHFGQARLEMPMRYPGGGARQAFGEGSPGFREVGARNLTSCIL